MPQSVLCEGLLPPQGEPALIAVKPVVILIRIGRDTLLTFDRQGRLYSAFAGDRFYRRGLDNNVVVRGRRGSQVMPTLAFHSMGDEDRQAFLAWVLAQVQRVTEAMAEGRIWLRPFQEASPEALTQVRTALGAILQYNPSRLEEEGRAFATLCPPPRILPPDQLLALVLQLTEGCSWNRCAYCQLYRDRPFRIKPPAEFLAHIQQVKAFLGPALAFRRSIFLGDGDALAVPQQHLSKTLDLIHAEFEISQLSAPVRDCASPRFTGIYAFMDAFDLHGRSPLDFEALARRGLRRIYCGLDTGDDGLLKFLARRGKSADAWETISTLKEGGIPVGLIILLGAGGSFFAQSHVQETVRLLNALPLTSEDIIYFSPLVIHPGSDYDLKAQRLGIPPLSREALEEQRQAIIDELRYTDPERPPKLAPFDIRGFVY